MVFRLASDSDWPSSRPSLVFVSVAPKKCSLDPFFRVQTFHFYTHLFRTSCAAAAGATSSLALIALNRLSRSKLCLAASVSALAFASAAAARSASALHFSSSALFISSFLFASLALLLSRAFAYAAAAIFASAFWFNSSALLISSLLSTSSTFMASHILSRGSLW